MDLTASCTQCSFVILVFSEPLSTPLGALPPGSQINRQGYPASNLAETVYKQIYKWTSKDDSLNSVAIMCIQWSELNTDLFEILRSLWKNKKF